MKPLHFLPFAMLALICLLMAWALHRAEPERSSGHSSPLIGKPLAAFTLPGLDGKAFDSASLKGKLVIINVFASWCAPCVQEHPLLVDLAKNKDATIVGIGWRDTQSKIDDFLNQHGNPYNHVLIDTAGATTMKLALTGIPETFLVDSGGIVRYKHTGPLSAEVITRDVLPFLQHSQ